MISAVRLDLSYLLIAFWIFLVFGAWAWLFEDFLAIPLREFWRVVPVMTIFAIFLVVVPPIAPIIYLTALRVRDDTVSSPVKGTTQN